LFVHTFSHLQSFHTRVAPLPDGFRVRVRLVLRIVGQDGIDHEALKEVEESAHSGEGLCREVIMGRVKGQNAPNFCLI